MNVGEDSFRHQGLRRKLVDQLRKRGIGNVEVLNAIGKIPRHLFIDDSAFVEMAYADTAFPIPCGQTISQPWTVAFQTDLLQVGKGMKVLEIGTGSGYQTAVLCTLGAKVHSIERHRPLYLQTKERLLRMGHKAYTVHGDGFAGLTREAPFDRVLVTCGAPFVPKPLLEQLKPGGRLVIPVGEGAVQEMMLITKDERGTLFEEACGQFKFVPMLSERSFGV
ncbi:MAG: protein-L-isoaspartate(D-aspartate) O-methyltransferase [Flavobacteriales bacterium]|jgi:protein-L-isoaspartate(D-aspartate) O-methyltransferase|nr:protein-L-isoaspartate(D-aspartate) O-methyltransferase [Flavobacteriales bacterium]